MSTQFLRYFYDCATPVLVPCKVFMAALSEFLVEEENIMYFSMINEGQLESIKSRLKTVQGLDWGDARGIYNCIVGKQMEE